MIDLMNLESLESTWINLFLLGERSSPFIDEGDGLTSERERVRMLLSLVAHAGGYRMMVALTTLLNVRCTWEVCVVFFRYGRCRHLPHC